MRENAGAVSTVPAIGRTRVAPQGQKNGRLGGARREQSEVGSGGYGPAVTWSAFDIFEIDAIEQHVQVGGADLQAGAIGLGKTEGPFFEPFEARITLPSYSGRYK
jgi:hypothetical protein